MKSHLKSAACTTGAVVAIIVTLKYLAAHYRSKVLVPRLTILEDLPEIGKPRNGERIKGQVVIAGGSIAGLYAAAVCSMHFERVLIVDPEPVDALMTFQPTRNTSLSPDGYITLSKKQTRVAQYDSIHAFQPISPIVMMRLFPHYESEINKLGIVPGPADFCSAVNGKPLPFPFHNRHDAPSTLYITRESYETLLRRLVVQDCRNVRFDTGIVTGLKVSTESPRTVTGASVRFTEQGIEVVNSAALVVDASGPSQAGFTKWLPNLGLALPARLRERYDPRYQGVTVLIYIPPDIQAKLPIPWGFQSQRWLHTAFPLPGTGETRYFMGGVVDGDQLVLGVSGWGLTENLTSLESIRAFHEAMRGGSDPPWINQMLDVLIEHQDELKPLYIPTKPTALSYIHFQKALNEIPHNFVAIGDSVSVVNPIYGQGCSKAIIGAVTLDRLLRKCSGSLVDYSSGLPTSFSRELFSLQHSRIRHLWNSNKVTDYGFDSTIPAEGEKAGAYSGGRRFGRIVTSLIRSDLEIARTCYLNSMFLAVPTDLIRPWFLVKLLWGWMVGPGL